MVERVLVTGGQGKVGRLLVEQLRKQGCDVRVAARQPALKDEVRFDWADRTTHASALDGVGAVFLTAPTDRADHLEVMLPLLEQAVRQEIGPLVLLSAAALPAGAPMMGGVHAWLRSHAPRWVALRPSWFMQNFVTQHLPDIKDEGVIYSATGEGRVPFIDAADIASVAVEALMNDQLNARELVLTGPRVLSYDEVASLISLVSDRPVRHQQLSADELAVRLEGFGLTADYATLLAAMDASIAQGSEDRTTDTVVHLTGREPRSFETFLDAHRADFA